MRGEIRKNLKNSVVEIENMNPKYDYVDLSEVLEYINQIESDVNEIKDKLDQYRCLSEIDDIYNMADKLSDKLY
jgi:hypothetical protein